MDVFEYLSKFHFVNEFWAFLLPLIMMAIDFLTGTINAWIKGEIQSTKMRQGLGKKIGEIVALLVGGMISYALGLTHYVSTVVSLYIVVMEMISICENMKKLGVPIPKFIDAAFKNVENIVDNKELTEEDVQKLLEKINKEK